MLGTSIRTRSNHRPQPRSSATDTEVMDVPAVRPLSSRPDHKIRDYGQSAADGAHFWRRYLAGIDAPQFPAVPSTEKHFMPDKALAFTYEKRYRPPENVTATAMLFVAWAALVGTYTNSTDLVFGALQSSHPTPDSSPVDLVPVRIAFDWRMRLHELLQMVQAHESEAGPFKSMGIPKIRLLSADAEQACRFQSVVVLKDSKFGPSEHSVAHDSAISSMHEEHAQSADIINKCPMVVECSLHSDKLYLKVRFDPHVLTETWVGQVAQQLEHVLWQICNVGSVDTRLSDLQTASDQDLQVIGQWNATAPKEVFTCVHDIITNIVRQQPDSPAICSWDGELTYDQLDVLSNRLAHKLANLGVGSGTENETIVPLCFEKSKWTPVAMLGVMKAGGASVILDITQPLDRLRAIVQQVDSNIILASRLNASLGHQLNRSEPLVVDESCLSEGIADALPAGRVTPLDQLYVVFTSGSSGNPKGVIVTHANFASAIHHQQQLLRFNASSRVYDFFSYAFDLAWSNFLHSLTAGGCLCIPSEYERINDVTGSLVRLRANYLHITPSVGRTIDPSTIQQLKILHFSGEALRDDDLRRVGTTTPIINSYGPAECTLIVSSVYMSPGTIAMPGIGRGVGSRLWIVNAETEADLVAVGGVGELWIEGPLVGRGYLKDPDMTVTSFTERPKWLVKTQLGQVGEHGRFYRTGDLVRYHLDGSLRYVGRKDRQVKLRGQRIELEEIDTSIQYLLDRHFTHATASKIADVQIVSEVITPEGTDAQMLVAFVAPKRVGSLTDERLSDYAEWMSHNLGTMFASMLPSYMIPVTYIPITVMPTTATHKLDRRQLRRLGAASRSKNLEVMQKEQHRRPETRAEVSLQGLWASVLGIDIGVICATDSFLCIGGDSIAAMQLAAAARRGGITLTVADILKCPQLDRMAECITWCPTVPLLETEEPYSLLPQTLNVSVVRQQAASFCKVGAEQIHDIFPCTPLQEGLLAMTARRPGDYVAHEVFTLAPTIDLDKFTRAWLNTVQASQILRTRIVDLTDYGLVQVVLDEPGSLERVTNIEDFMTNSDHKSIGLGTPLYKAALEMAIDGKQARFMLLMHHSIFDGWSINLLMHAVQSAYFERSFEQLLPMQGFIRYLQGTDEHAATSYWEQELADSEADLFPSLPSPTFQPQPHARLEHIVDNLVHLARDTTMSTVIRTALAILQARYTDAREAVFGATVIGRQAPVAGIERVCGPTIATVPLRIPIDIEQRVFELLQQVQRQAIQMIAHEQFGIQHIQHISQEARQCCAFQTLLVVQPEQAASDSHGDDLFQRYEQKGLTAPDDHFSSFNTHNTYALTIICTIRKASIHFHISYDPMVLYTTQVQHLSHQLEHILRQLVTRPHIKVREVCAISSADLAEIWRWNATSPKSEEGVVHDLITARALTQPSAPAICAWDGELTYAQLDDLSSRLAYHLIALGVGRGVIVPLCFEKSMWTPVATLGVMKAGGASAPMDTSLPGLRLQSQIDQVARSVILSSVRMKSLAASLTGHKTIVVEPEEFLKQQDSAMVELHMPNVSPSDTLYVVFTSGTTGTPKGVVIAHANFCSAVLLQQEKLGISQQCRIYDFASYAFDVSWFNLLHALTAGACLCIPSEDDRKNDIVGSIRRLRANYVPFTPSVLRTLDPKELPEVACLRLGGEALMDGDVMPWRVPGRQIINTYGPAECTITSCISDFSVSGPGDNHIGKGVGMTTWVLESSTTQGRMGQALAAIGAVGELWLEGPLVGRGYLNDLEKTAASFVDSPHWLCQGTPDQPGRRGRLYRTGDLVRYCPDGSLQFIGRKDGQVKINGQRVELGEVEFHIRQMLQEFIGTRAIQVAAEVVKLHGSDKKTLVAFMSARGIPETDKKQFSDTITQMTIGLNDKLAAVLPLHMIPTGYVEVAVVPMTATGKVNRRQLRQQSTMLNLAKVTGAPHEDDVVKPRSASERTLQLVWAQVLNLTAASISVESSFVHLGGDSITAMQVVSRCRSHNLRLTVANILGSRTIRQIAKQCKSSSPSTVGDNQEDSDITSHQRWVLSPMQKMFFAAHPDGLNHFNQTFVLRLKMFVRHDTVEKALLALAQRHSMLRARFCRTDNGVWEQFVVPCEAGAIGLAKHTIADIREIESLGKQTQRALDLQNGPVFAGHMFNIDHEQPILLLSAHHLVVDLVSWRVIWSDLQDLLGGRELSRAPVSFRRWCVLQEKHARLLLPETVLPYTVELPNFAYWGIEPKQNHFGDIALLVTKIDSKATSILLNKTNEALRAEILDILLAVLGETFRELFPNRETPAIFLKGHGREQIQDLEVDVSETVGSFTTMYPVVLPYVQGLHISESIRLIKDVRYSVPGKGRPYFACRYHSDAGRQSFEADEDVEILLNYTGAFHQFEHDESIFARLDGNDAPLMLHDDSQTARRFSLIMVTVNVDGEQMNVSFELNRWMRHYNRLEQWPRMFSRRLSEAVNELTQMKPQATLSDFPLLSVSYKGLDALIADRLAAIGIGIQRVRDIFPCTPLQEGILLSKKRETASYAIRWIWKCEDSNEQTVNVDRLFQSWKLTLSRHSVLSTIFTDLPDSGQFVQVVLQPIEPRIEVTHSSLLSSEQMLESLGVPTFEAHEPEYLVTICQGERGDVACRLDINHALIDAASMALITRDLARSYVGDDLSPTPQFREAIAYLDKVSRPERLQYWTTFLRNVKPCILPMQQMTSSESAAPDVMFIAPLRVANETEIYDACKRSGVTRSCFLQVAWAIALSYLTMMSRPCFGYLASGRDMPVEGIEEIVGPLINMLVGFIDLDQSYMGVITAASKDSIEHFDHQYISLAEVQHEIGPRNSRLFNTAMTVRESYGIRPGRAGLQLLETGGEDPHEFDVLVAANLDGPRTQIHLSFRRNYTSNTVAYHYRDVVEAAIEYMLLQCRIDGNVSTSSVRDDFFLYYSGAKEDAAAHYWKHELAGSEAITFPLLPSPVLSPRPDVTAEYTVERVASEAKHVISISATVRAAWAILQAQYTNASSATFGVVAFDAHDSISHAHAYLMPMSIRVDTDATVIQLTEQVHRQSTEMLAYAKVGLHRIRQLDEETEQCCQFQTLIVVKSRNDEGLHQSTAAQSAGNVYGMYALIVICSVYGSGVHIQMNYDPRVVSDTQVQRTVRQFGQIIWQMTSKNIARVNVRDISVVSKADLAQISAWNAYLPVEIDVCVHDLIATTTRQQLDALAVHAWDGELTYRQLDILSNRLANQLVALGVKSNVVVPLCFEKSVWMPVAMMGVMKAGGASLAVDIMQPIARLRVMVHRVRPVVLVSSVKQAELARSLSPKTAVLAVDSEYLDQITTDQSHEPSKTVSLVEPESILYLVFTSGSTGVPKAVAISHSNVSSALTYQATSIGLNTASRVLDMAAYSFDVIWYNALHTFYAGGLLCIPRQQQTPSDAIRLLRPNFVNLTPSVASTLDDDALQALTTVELIGEVADAKLLSKLKSCRQCRNTYGPTESTTFCCASEDMRTPSHIGVAVGVRTWIVDPVSGGRLAPVGAIGELWLEGPLVATGYFDDMVETDASFVEDPVWMAGLFQATTRRKRKLYRTGDLVRYEDDGSLTFIGRKDAQVKIRGQRVELREVEHHVGQLLDRDAAALVDSGARVVADVMKPVGSDNPTLVAFVAPANGSQLTKEERDLAVVELTRDINETLSELLPAFMVPRAYIPITSIPMTATGKMDRRRVREMGSGITAEFLATLGRQENTPRRPPKSVVEIRLRHMWSTVLSIEEDSIGFDDSFMRVGGNSILAMRLVALAREQGFGLDIQEVFRRPRLGELANTMMTVDGEDDDTIAKLALLPGNDPVEFLNRHILPQLPGERADVLDVYPVSYVQMRYLNDPATNAPRLPHFFIMDFSLGIDVHRLGESLDALVQHFDVLRTVFVLAQGIHYQVVLQTLRIPLESRKVAGDIELATEQVWIEDQQKFPLRLGHSFLRFVALERAESGVRLMMRISHSQWDGMSFAHLIPALGAIYHKQHLTTPQPFAHYINHATHKNRDAAYAHWHSLLQGSVMTRTKPPKDSTHHMSIISRTRTVSIPYAIVSEDITSATIFTAACAVMLARVSESQDVVFGRVVAGRHSLPVKDQTLAGPCVNCIPVRLQVNENNQDGLLASIQAQFIDSLPFETVGIHEIIANCVSWPNEVDDFWCLTQYRNTGPAAYTDIAGSRVPVRSYRPRRMLVSSSPTHQVEVIATPQGKDLHICIDAASRACTPEIVDFMLDELCTAITTLC